jgi:hypothetical protein
LPPYAAARQVDAGRDAKLNALRETIPTNANTRSNPGNKKIIIFTAFADTANYLYENLAAWAKETLAVDTALVTGTGRNKTSLPHFAKTSRHFDLFSPRSKERPAELATKANWIC